jgi:hypothetical protein
MRGAQDAARISGPYMMYRAKALVKKFTSAARLEDRARSEKQTQEIAMAAVQGFILVAAALLAIPTIGATGPAAVTAAATSVGASIVSSSYVATMGVAKNLMPDGTPDYTNMVLDMYTGTMADVIHVRETNFANMFRDLLKGEPLHNGDTIDDFLTAEEFLGLDPDLVPFLQKREKQLMFAAGINMVWLFERPYILDVDTPNGCENDMRGPRENRICLPEFPNRSFWLYSIGRGRENDLLYTRQEMVTGPTNFHAFDEEHEKTHSITREDILRSALVVHRNQLQTSITNRNITQIIAALEKETIGSWGDDDPVLNSEKVRNVGKVPGMFMIPICRNPGGEAISSVWSNGGRNYPCMCGEFPWRTTATDYWHIDKDETLRFLELSGFKFSEDWEDYCSNHNKCNKREDIDFYSMLDATRYPGDPPVASWIQHPYRECLRVKDHYDHGYPEKDYLDEPY